MESGIERQDSNTGRIYNWWTEGTNDSVKYTTIFSAPNLTYLGNMVQHFAIESSNNFIYYTLYCLEAEPRHPDLSYMQLFSSLYIF